MLGRPRRVARRTTRRVADILDVGRTSPAIGSVAWVGEAVPFRLVVVDPPGVRWAARFARKWFGSSQSKSPLNAYQFGGTSKRFQRRNSYAWSESDRALPIPT